MKKLAVSMIIVLTAAIALAGPGIQGRTASSLSPLEKKVFNALVTLPHYGVFDNLSFEVNGDIVTLAGQAMLPNTKQDAAARVSKIPGVAKVVDNIEALPQSPNDDSLRIFAYRALFGTADLYRYALAPNPTIHIIVKNGRITLEGNVSTEADAKLALLAVRGIPGVFSAASNLKVVK
jgi:hypothetical protein